MIPYILLFAIPPIVAYVFCSASSKRDKMPKVAIAVFFAIFIFLLCVRDKSIGIDNRNYEWIYNRVSSVGWEHVPNSFELEKGYLYLNKIVSDWFGSYQALMAVAAVLATIPLVIFYVKENKSVVLTIALFLVATPFTCYFSSLRQVIAIGIAVPLYYLARKKKLIWFILLVILAMQFHVSAFVMFALYPVVNTRFTEKGLFFSIPLIVAVYVFNEPIFNFLKEFVKDEYTYDTEQTGAFMMIILFALFVIFAFVAIDEKSLTKEEIGLRNILVICLIFQLFAPVNMVVMRMNYYYMIFVPIALSKLMQKPRKGFEQVVKLASVVMTIFFLGYFVYEGFNGEDMLHTYPYKFCWES
ncbi:MAG: EpsG family protein [Clostridia bacterium]|nr:EpsG family protein [Clostridia bacterium]